MTIFKPMKSIAPDETKHPVRFPLLASPKLDGIRFTMHNGQAITKSGKPIPNKVIAKYLADHLSEGCDGELGSGSPIAPDFYRNTFTNVMTKDLENPDFNVYLFDYADVTQTAEVRYRKLVQDYGSFETMNNPNALAECSRLYKHKVINVLYKGSVHTREALDRFYNACLDLGFEGAITQNPTGLYKLGRSTAKCQTQLKWKPEDDHDAFVIGAFEAMENQNEAFLNELGETERSSHQANKVGKRMLGGFFCRDVATGIEFRCGAGKLTHEERIAVWDVFKVDGKLPSRYIKYRSMSYGVHEAPRMPRFYAWRDATDVETVKE